MEFRSRLHHQMCNSARGEMICIKSHFYLNRILLLAIGLWPYQQTTKLVRLQIIFIFCLLISFIVFQLTTFLTTKCTLDLVIKILIPVILIFMDIIQYNSFWVNMQTMKYLLEQLQHICNELKDENEIAIIKKYGNYVKLYTTGVILFTISGAIIFISLPFMNDISEIVLRINVSRSHHEIQFMTEYFVDQETYFYLIVLHMSASCCIGIVVIIAIGSLMVGCIIHFCGLFKIASYRIEHAMASSILQNINLENQIMIYNEIVLAVHVHRQAIKYSTFLVSSFTELFFFLILVTVFCLSLSFFRILSFGGNPEEFLLQFSYACIILVYMFVGNYAGQEIIDHNNHVFSTAYNVQWYVTPLRIQKLILLLLQRGNKPFYLNIGGLFIGSLESFGMLMNASLSYFTVMYSIQ